MYPLSTGELDLIGHYTLDEGFKSTPINPVMDRISKPLYDAYPQGGCDEDHHNGWRRPDRQVAV